jgi:pentatricopeptide repeat protein
MDQVELMSRLQSHKRRLESGELNGAEHKRKRKRLMIKISSIKKQLAGAGNNGNSDGQNNDSYKQVQVRDSNSHTNNKNDSSKINNNNNKKERKKINRKKKKKKTMHLNKELKDLAQRKQLKRAMVTFGKGERKEIVDVHSYTNMINAFIRCSKLSLAQELFKQMKQKKFKPNVVTYTILIKGAFNEYNIPLAKELFDEMIGSKVAANVRTHNAFLRGCIQTGAIQEAIVHFRNMKVMPDVTTYESVVSLLCRGGKLSEAISVISAIDSISKENPALYFALARAYGLKHDWLNFQAYVKIFQEKLKHNDMLARQIELRRQNDPSEKEKEEHYLERVRSIRQFAEHRQEEFFLHSIEFQSIINARKLLSTSQYNDFDLNFYLSQVLVIKNQAASSLDDNDCIQVDDERTKKERVDYALTKLKDSFGLKDTDANVKIVRDLLEARFDSNGRIKNNISSSTPVKLDLCAGSGEWALAQAKNDPGSLWITLELKSDRVYDTFWGMAMQKQRNFLAMQGDAHYVVEHCIPSNFVDYIYVNHPEPPERTGGTDDSDGEHLLTHVFFKKMFNILKENGKIVIVTDNRYYGESLSKISNNCGFADYYKTEEDKKAQQGYMPNHNIHDDDNKSSNNNNSVTLHEGIPSGHNNNASTRFDRLWSKGEKNRRFFICVSKKNKIINGVTDDDK